MQSLVRELRSHMPDGTIEKGGKNITDQGRSWTHMQNPQRNFSKSIQQDIQMITNCDKAGSFPEMQGWFNSQNQWFMSLTVKNILILDDFNWCTKACAQTPSWLKRIFLILGSIVIGGNFTYRIKKLQENFQLTSQGEWGDWGFSRKARKETRYLLSPLSLRIVLEVPARLCASNTTIRLKPCIISQHPPNWGLCSFLHWAAGEGGGWGTVPGRLNWEERATDVVSAELFQGKFKLGLGFLQKPDLFSLANQKRQGINKCNYGQNVQQ